MDGKHILALVLTANSFVNSWKFGCNPLASLCFASAIGSAIGVSYKIALGISGAISANNETESWLNDENTI